MQQVPVSCELGTATKLRTVCRLGMPAMEGRGLWRLPRPLPQPLPPPLSPQCSVTCGKGYKQRLVSCSEIYTGKENYEYGHQTATSCPGTQPPSVHPCYLRECPVSATWRVGNWGSVSKMVVSSNPRGWDGKPHHRTACLTCLVILLLEETG